MADRGRKAFPVSSHVCDERWQRHCMDLHKQRLAEMKHQVDTKQPETFDIQLSKGKRAMLEKERQFEIDRENAILLQKMVRIKEQDTRAVFRPWTARSTFQWKLGHYYDPTTGTKTLDHINLTSASSPRSIHYYSVTRPGTAPPDVTARLRDMQIQTDNTKLLRAITTMRSRYSVDDLERRHAEESVLVNRVSNFRGPETARYQPPGRSSSASRRSPYLAGQPPSRGGSRRSLPTAGSHASLQRYYEEAQSRDLPPAYSPRSSGGSRPGTAAVAPSQQGLGLGLGLGETTPRSRGGSGSGKGSPLGSVYGSRPESASQRPPFGSAQGRSFSFDQRQREQEDQERQRQAREEAAAGSGDEYADEQYERDEQEEDARSARAEEEEEGARASASGSRQAEEEEGGDGYGDEGFEPDGEAGGQEEEAEEEQQQDEEEARTSASGAYGEEEEEEQASGDEEAAGYGFQQDEEQGQEEEAGDQQDGGAEDEDAAGSPRGSAAGDDEDGAEAAGADGEEERGQEDGYGDGYEQEEAGQAGAADEEGQAEEAGGDGGEGVAAGDDDGGVGGSGEEDLAAYRYALPATTAADDDAAESAGQQSLKVGGFAADWD